MIVVARQTVLSRQRYNMLVHAKLQLQGEYTVNVFHGNGTLRYSTGPHKNFITSTGLSMPYHVAFADCFRYLSLGSGDAYNTIETGTNGVGTTGLNQPLGSFSYIGGRTQKNDGDHEYTQYSSASFSESENTLSLSRGWRVPIGDATFDTNYNFREFMISPGRPYVTGISNSALYSKVAITAYSSTSAQASSATWAVNAYVGDAVAFYDGSNILRATRKITTNSSNTVNFATISWPENPVTNSWQLGIYPYYNLCHCDEYINDIHDNSSVHGQDYTATADEYRNRGYPICRETGAFVRVVKDIDVTAGDYLTLTYTLKITIDSGHNTFNVVPNAAGRPIDQTDGQGNVDNDNWRTFNVSGKSALLHHGLKLVNPGTISANGPWGGITQPSTQFSSASDYGESYVGSWGDPLEPYITNTYLGGYVSTDWLQFTVNAASGGASGNGSYRNNGLMAWRKTPTNDASSSFPSRWFNIRQPNDANGVGSSNKSPNATGYFADSTDPINDFGYLVTFAEPRAVAVEYSSYVVSGRSRSVGRNFEYAGPIINGNPSPNMINEPVRAIVLSYVDPVHSYYHIPYFDMMIADTGYHLTPALNASTYYIDTGDNGNSPSVPKWYYIADNSKLTLFFQETWSSPCDTSVEGCPGGP